jgi:sugar lactone lactonase YvrE
MRRHKTLQLLALILLLSSGAGGTETAFWQVGSFEEFLQGTLANVSLDTEGDLRLAPASRVVFNPEEALALALTSDRKGNVYVGTGHQGKVFRVDRTQKASLWFTARESDVFALTTGPDGSLYVGSSPEGKVYRVTPDGQSTVFYDPHTKYIWALALDAQGRLYVATGDKGQIFRVDPTGKADLFFGSKQTHIMCLAFDKDGNLLAGSVPKGLIYRITPAGKAFVLYESSLPEIHDLVADSQGRIYAAALGGAGSKGSPELLIPATSGAVSGGVTTVTVTASEEIHSLNASEVQNPPTEALGAPSFNRQAPAAAIPNFQIPQGRGSLVKILPDSSAETIWNSNNESIFGLAVHGDHVLFSTDSNGRIFDVVPGRDAERVTLITETHQSLATRLMQDGSDLYVATSNIAELLRVASDISAEGSYESPVKDTRLTSHWGVLAWRAEVPTGATLEFFTRSGNSERPDPTWSDWAGPYRDPNGSPIGSPVARYVQWKAVFRASGSTGPKLDDVTLSYLNQNLPPQIRFLNVSTAGERTNPAGSSSASLGTGTTISVGSQTSGSYGSGTSAGGTAGKIPLTLNWQAEDPNSDQLVYSLYVKAVDEQEWHLLKDKLHQSAYTIDPGTLPDGKYVAKLVVSDEESNPPETARKSELLSAPFWVDNTPPQVRVLRQNVSEGGGEVVFEVEDSTSPLRSAETSTDGKPWKDLLSDDGVVDSRKETFTVKLTKLEAGEHVVSVRAYDTAGNLGVGKAVLRVPPQPGAARQTHGTPADRVAGRAAN